MKNKMSSNIKLSQKEHEIDVEKIWQITAPFIQNFANSGLKGVDLLVAMAIMAAHISFSCEGRVGVDKVLDSVKEVAQQFRVLAAELGENGGFAE